MQQGDGSIGYFKIKRKVKLLYKFEILEGTLVSLTRKLVALDGLGADAFSVILSQGGFKETKEFAVLHSLFCQVSKTKSNCSSLILIPPLLLEKILNLEKRNPENLLSTAISSIIPFNKFEEKSNEENLVSELCSFVTSFLWTAAIMESEKIH